MRPSDPSPGPRRAAGLVLAATMLTILMPGCSRYLVRKFAFHPQRLPADTPVAAPGVEELWLTSSDGTRIHSLLLHREGNRSAVLFLHGNAGHALHRVEHAQRLADLGVSVLLVDYRGYGKSDGTPSEDGVYLDARAALDHLHRELGFAHRDVVLLGRSLGSAIAVHVARDHDVAGLILVAPLSSGRDVARTQGIGWLAWLAGSPFDSVSKVSTARCPALFIHGETDRVIPLELGARLFDAYGDPRKHMHVIAQAGHDDVIHRAGDAYWRWVEDFLDDPTRTGAPALDSP